MHEFLLHFLVLTIISGDILLNVIELIHNQDISFFLDSARQKKKKEKKSKNKNKTNEIIYNLIKHDCFSKIAT